MKSTNQLKYISVSEFNKCISNIIRAEEMLYNLTILGEISQMSIYGKNAYFTIKDNDAELSCTCFNYSKTYKPKIGESVLVTGSPNFYVKKGKLSFNVSIVQPFGQGLLYVQLEKLKEKLRAEGLFENQYKKAIPMFPNNICVITSINGAVIRDIVTTIRNRNDIINISVYDVRVQGEGSVSSIIRALIDTDNMGYDVLILARGGGSLEDLMPFNDEKLARSIFKLKTPIISAIGHETDFSISDFVADKRAATPTAAGELVAYDVSEWRCYCIKQAEYICKLIENKYNALNNRVCNNINLINYQATIRHERNVNKVKSLISRSIELIDKSYSNKEHLLDKLITSLDSNSPIKILKSGYFRVNVDKRPIYSIKQMHIDDVITLTSSDGKAKAKVLEIEEDQK